MGKIWNFKIEIIKIEKFSFLVNNKNYVDIKKDPYFNRSSKGFKIYYKKGFIREYILFGE